MPFWKKEKKAAAVQENGSASNGTTTSNGSNSSGENGVGSSNGGGAWVKDPKVNYKARLEHKQYLVSGLGMGSVQDLLDDMTFLSIGLSLCWG